MSVHLDRALVLFQQDRPELAERELRLELARNPSNATAHSLLSLSLAAMEKYEEATREAQEAVGLAPDLPFAHYALANALHDRNRFKEAGAAVREAIRLDPTSPDYFALQANIRFNQRHWREALAAAEKGLALDPEHDGCTNLRAMALVKLGRRGEAGLTIDSALARDPENALTHANRGWALLHQADYGKALEHFREAIRLNPELEWAQQGIVEALKARHLIYGLMLRYFLWMSRLSGRAQWAVILAAVFGYRLLRNVARSNPSFAPFIWPVLITYGIFVLLTWTASPLFNLLLRLDRFGRLALSKDETAASNWVGGAILVALLAAGVWLVTGSSGGLLVALFGGALVLPLSGIFRCQPGWPRKVMRSYTGLLIAVGVLALVLSLLTPESEAASGLFALAIVGALLSGWGTNILAMVNPKR